MGALLPPRITRPPFIGRPVGTGPRKMPRQAIGQSRPAADETQFGGEK